MSALDFHPLCKLFSVYMSRSPSWLVKPLRSESTCNLDSPAHRVSACIVELFSLFSNSLVVRTESLTLSESLLGNLGWMYGQTFLLGLCG